LHRLGVEVEELARGTLRGVLAGTEQEIVEQPQRDEDREREAGEQADRERRPRLLGARSARG
jgi:hypothetical protein